MAIVAQCFHDFSVYMCTDYEGRRCRTYKETYKSWFNVFKRYNYNITSVTRKLCLKIQSFLRFKGFEYMSTKGLPNNVINEAEAILNVNFPNSLRCLLLSMDGQPENCIISGLQHQEYRGFIGTYWTCNTFVCSKLLSLREICSFTIDLRLSVPCFPANLVSFGCSLDASKIYFINVHSGDIFITSKDFRLNSEVMLCTPISVRGEMSLICWLAKLSSNLHTGKSCLIQNPIKAIFQGGLAANSLYHHGCVPIPELSSFASDEFTYVAFICIDSEYLSLYNNIYLCASHKSKSNVNDTLLHKFSIWFGSQEEYCYDGRTYGVMTKKFTLEVPLCTVWVACKSESETLTKSLDVSFLDYMF
ncbi:hypothetical protein SELMODRAFT_419093 [Selaginella moellendorffii]|uniref:Uncharacterized protein n=1 Tax=Selaginella moellendorffii TaxID=88036 RepID=D8S7T9_SELML|nr:hypothetical protein SELMODRAFT_419093 [Selaginella moellendorffii]